MKNKKLILFIISFIAISGFAYAGYIIKQQQSKINLLAEKIDRDNFQKKIDCNKYADKIKQEIDKYNTGGYLGLSLGTKNFELIFYSTKENSCLYAVQVLGDDREYYIYNALTKSKVTSFKFPDQWQNYRDFLFEYSDGEIRL